MIFCRINWEIVVFIGPWKIHLISSSFPIIQFQLYPVYQFNDNKKKPPYYKEALILKFVTAILTT